MSDLSWLSLDRDGDALLGPDGATSYRALGQKVAAARAALRQAALNAGEVVAFEAPATPEAIARYLAVLLEGLVAAPISTQVANEQQAALATVPADAWWPAEATQPTRRAPSPHPLLTALKGRGHPGLIILTSGSTGQSKVILHDAHRLLKRLSAPKRPYRAVVFLLLDHMGGFNTLFGLLSSGSTLILPDVRGPEAVAALVANTKATLLPVTPSFLSLLLASGAHLRHDLSSLKVVSYGTEVMPSALLAQAQAALPHARFVQLYGTSELGIFKSEPASGTSVHLKADGVAIKVEGGRLFVRGADSMLGYLSDTGDPSPGEGWYDTGDAVEVDSDGALRILGRASELINVGGLKVFPAEVEDALLKVSGVLDCAAYGIAHPLLGQVVGATVALAEPEATLDFSRRMRGALKGVLEPYKVPVKVKVGEVEVSARFKKRRGP